MPRFSLRWPGQRVYVAQLTAAATLLAELWIIRSSSEQLNQSAECDHRSHTTDYASCRHRTEIPAVETSSRVGRHEPDLARLHDVSTVANARYVSSLAVTIQWPRVRHEPPSGREYFPPTAMASRTRRAGDNQREKRDSLIRNISRRLRPVCKEMPQREFDAMVRRMAEIELKYAGQATPSQPGDRAE